MARARDDVGDEVHRAAPRDFVRTRNAVAARLQQAGRAAEAAEVRRLRKPSPALWAVNQLAHTHADELGAFLAAVDQLRKVQLGHAGPQIAAAATRQRNALENLVTLASGLLGRAHVVTTPAVVRRVSDTLLGAAAAQDSREPLRRGRLAGELPAPGFEAFSGITPANRPARPAPPKPAPAPESPSPREARAAKAEAAQREREAARRRQRAEQSARRVAKATKVVERRQRQLREAQARLEQQRAAAEE